MSKWSTLWSYVNPWQCTNLGVREELAIERDRERARTARLRSLSVDWDAFREANAAQIEADLVGGIEPRSGAGYDLDDDEPDDEPDESAASG